MIKKEYRISSVRLQTWDYGNIGSYFITICTKNMKHFFGEIADDEMHLNEIGKIAEQEWIKTIELRPDMNLELGEFVVIPNHFHGIIIIGENQYNTKIDISKKDISNADAVHSVSTTMNQEMNENISRTDAMHGVCTKNDYEKNINKFGPQSNNLSSIIRGFKSSVTTQAKKIGIRDFSWQPRFHDHIIRDAESFERIQDYIIDNPKNWKKDKFYS